MCAQRTGINIGTRGSCISFEAFLSKILILYLLFHTLTLRVQRVLECYILLIICYLDELLMTVYSSYSNSSLMF